MNILLRTYRKYVSASVRHRLFLGLGGRFFLQLPEIIKCKFTYLFRRFIPDNERNRLLALAGKYGVAFVPSQNYKKRKIECRIDKRCGLYYVLHHSNKLYFPKNYTRGETIEYYRGLLYEQDDNSPHKYITNYNRLRGKTVLDIGAAEGIFALDAVDYAEHIYLFECESKWLEPLRHTFAPFANKITIVQKYVSDINDDSNVTIDKFLLEKSSGNLFIKMDIEGYEQSALRGAINTFLNNADIDFSICTYHKKDDAVQIAKFLENYSINYEQTDGYMLFEHDIRRAIIRRKI